MQDTATSHNSPWMEKTQSLASLCLYLNLFIIVWGAVVRITGSGAGCGEHWPLCNGQIVPVEGSIKTFIEYTHRVTSGLDLILVLCLLVLVFKSFPQKQCQQRKVVSWTFFFLILEALLGAVLVKLKLVENNSSLTRGLVLCFHLCNTFLLIGSLTKLVTLMSEFSQRNTTSLESKSSMLGPVIKFMIPKPQVQFMFLLTAISGGIAALGNTLFPPSSLKNGLLEDFDVSSHLFLRLRILHPFLACALAAIVLLHLWKGFSELQFKTPTNTKIPCTTSSFYPKMDVVTWIKTAFGIVFIQILVGFLNLAFLAPRILQIVHLVLANFLWIALITIWTLANFTQQNLDKQLRPQEPK